jgi:methionyl-tRNA formyltransferase
MFNHKNQETNFKKRVLFIGIPDMAFVCLDGLNISGVNIVGVIGPKKDHMTYSNFKQFVEMRNLNYIEFDNLKEDSLIEKIKDLNVDVAVVCSFNYKIPKVLLECVEDGFINVHPSLLPQYRGANPYSHVIINDEKQTGVTLHFMDEGFDTGDIIVQQKIDISPRETMGTLFNRLNVVGLQLLLRVLADYEKGPVPKVKQKQGEFIVGGNIADEELYLDYSKSAHELERFLRSLNPFFAVSTSFRNTMVRVYSAEVVTQAPDSDYPVGTIEYIKDDKFYIKTQDGLLAPTVLQFGSFFVGSSKEFIQILNLKVGEVFE